jgi:hypothetical protein
MLMKGGGASALKVAVTSTSAVTPMSVREAVMTPSDH